MPIGERIKELRLKQNLKQSDLAEKAQISRVAIGNYERGDRIPNADILQSIANALGVSINDLMDFEELKKEVTSVKYIDLSNVPTNLLIEELNKRDDFPIKLEVK